MGASAEARSYLEPGRAVVVRLTSQNLPAIENASEADIDWAFENGAIGRFVHLSASDDSFIQAGSWGTPGVFVPSDDPTVRDHWAFIHRTGSEPWKLEHFEPVGEREYEVGDTSRSNRSNERSSAISPATRRGGKSLRGCRWAKAPRCRPRARSLEADWQSCTRSYSMLGWLWSQGQ